MPRFVVLRHEPTVPDGKPLHWDFMVESGGVLRTWALSSQPQSDHLIDADRLADHRLAYLDFEGPLSDNRGVVSQWDAGTCQLCVDSDDEFRVELKGRVLSGVASLRRSTSDAQRWKFVFSSLESGSVR